MTKRELGLFSFADEKPDQAAGFFFQASLFPYLLFLYFLSRPSVTTPKIANFGFQFLLVFVVMTIVGGVLCKQKYDVSLADCDWIHGSAESLLTVSNILIVYGFQHAIRGKNGRDGSKGLWKAITVAFIYSIVILVYIIHGISSATFTSHSQFLDGIGNLIFIKRNEPQNALSVGTWCVHFFSVYEYLIAMNLVWHYGEVIGNEAWKGLSWDLLFLVTLQGFLTLFGNTTCMIAAYRIAKNSGWPNLDMEQIQEEKEEDDDDNHNTDIENIENVWKKTHRESFSQMTTKTSSFLFIKLMMIVPFTSYVVKYGELFLTVPFHPKPSNAIVSIFVIPLIVALYFTQLSCKVYELQSEFNDEIVDEETSLLQ
ncbi:hypothetical protein CTEN210_16507 [Chaetoceros tenuissimus]|uniref:Uncharacterized protein n=1 Tax=Chaetoceros tenuissimus TaxID=426638 RepID=A0AAD3HE67_9STRA|nr:hypothetical protein CTEN210_16507 [Chaetoceros tenuissimus]